MTTYVRAAEAARLLGVSRSTLYAYVSRGRIGRRTAADGRASLFALDEVEALAARSRRGRPAARPTIDVQIASAVTVLSEDGVTVRGHDLPSLVAAHRFEDVAELLWTGELPGEPATWPAPDADEAVLCDRIRALPGLSGIGRLAVAAQLLASIRPDDDPAAASRRLIILAPCLLGSTRTSGGFARRLAHAWRAKPSSALVDAIDAALGLLADHELATSTLAVRVAASVRTSSYGAFAAGLATLESALHGSASAASHRLLADCADRGATTVLQDHRRRGDRVPGFGHKVYRGVDPRFATMLEAVRPLDNRRRSTATVDALVAEAGRTLPHQPNIDLALGALTWVAGLEPDAPVFAVARIAGWGAHCAEEFAAPAVRFRGLARTPDP